MYPGCRHVIRWIASNLINNCDPKEMENNGIRRPFVASAETAPMRFQNIADFDVRDCRLNIVYRTRERQRSRQELDQQGELCIPRRSSTKYGRMLGVWWSTYRRPRAELTQPDKPIHLSVGEGSVGKFPYRLRSKRCVSRKNYYQEKKQ